MLEKITNIFSEEEIILAMLNSGNEEKVRKLVADEELIKKYIVLILEKDIALDEICDIAKNTTSPQLLDIIAKACIQVGVMASVCLQVGGDLDAYLDTYLIDIVLDNPYCSGETIVYAEENADRCWSRRVIECLEYISEDKYPKEKLLNIANADKKGDCSLGIVQLPNCDKEVFYKAFENSRCNPEDYSAICCIALEQSFTLKPDILEECLEHFTDDWVGIIYDTVNGCNEAYLERVMAKIEETAPADVCEEARELYKERKSINWCW